MPYNKLLGGIGLKIRFESAYRYCFLEDWMNSSAIRCYEKHSYLPRRPTEQLKSESKDSLATTTLRNAKSILNARMAVHETHEDASEFREW